VLKYSAAVKTLVGSMTNDDAKEAIVEMVSRFCDKPENEKLCTLIDKLKDRLIVKVDSSGADSTTVDATVAPDDEEAGRRRLLFDRGTGLPTPDDLLDAASNDQEAKGDFTLTDT